MRRSVLCWTFVAAISLIHPSIALGDRGTALDSAIMRFVFYERPAPVPCPRRNEKLRTSLPK